MEQRRNDAQRLGEENITRLMIRFSLPSVLAMAVNASYNLADTFFVSRLGSAAIAALSVAMPIQMLLGAIAIGTGVGAASLISRSLGAGNNETASRTAGQVILLGLFFGLAAALAGVFFLRPLLALFGATAEIIDPTAEYMSVIAGGAVLLFLIMMMNHTVRAEGNAMLPMFVMISSAVVNIVLDPIFIFALDMGVRGAAVATILSKVFGVAVLLWFYLGGKSILHVGWKQLQPDLKIIVEIYKVGLPSLFLQTSMQLALIVANRILGSFGYIPIAVMGLVMRFQMFVFMPVVGIAQGLLPIMGYNFGAQKYRRIREAILKGAGAGTLFSSLAGLLLFLFPTALLRIFTAEEAVLETGTGAVRVMVLMYPLVGTQIVSSTFFQAIGKGIPAMLLALLRQFIFYVPLLVILPAYFDLNGVWMAAPAADLLAFLVTVTVVTRECKRLKIPIFGAP
ncbi:MAG: MATE family efflux transporter [Firmicutes bacterium]|jgi:putative MATE family efflux protein|nr:MATE family efflux transporter [Bacillota bacterium]